MANYLDENGLKTLADNINGKFIPYTGAKKDINIGSHVFTVGDVNTVYTQTAPGSIALKNPMGTLSIGTYSVTVNDTTIYWPTVSADPNGKYLALKSDIPANIKDGTGNGSLNQIKDGTGTTFSIDDSSGNSKNPNAYALDNTIKGDIVFGGVGDYSTSLCGKSSAQGKRSVAQGTTTIAKGNYSHAEGDNSVALAPDSHAEGYATTTSGDASHSEGDNTVAQGNKSHAEGLSTKAIGEASHSEGKETSAESYASHTEGYKTRTTKEYAHAEGENTLASGQAAHAEGVYTVASGNASMAVGSYTKALGYGSFACGAATQAIGEYSFAQGYQTKASSPRQAVFGTLNSDDENALLIVGNGDGNGRKNVFTVNKDGTTTISKDPVNDFDVATKGYVDRKPGINKVGTVTKVNGTSPDSNGNVQLNIPTVNNGLLTIQRNGANVATFHANQSGDTLANISVPTELSQLGGRTFSNITSRGEEYLEWGGPAKVGDISPVGMAISSEHNANRIAFINPDALKFEYSSDGGLTWTDYPITGDGRNTKTRFCTLTQVYFIGRPDASTNLIANKSKTRITITGQDGTNLYLYTALKKMLIEVSTPTTLSMLIEKRTGTNYESNGPWETVGTYNLAGWSGWNDIPLDFNLGGGSNQKSNYWQMRLTITCVTVDSNYSKEGALRGLRLFGSTNWSLPSALASTGHIYSYDMDERVEFPSDVYASKFIENGQALSNKYLGISAQAADSAKLNGQDSSHYLTSIKINGTTKTSTNSTVDLGTVITSHQSLSGYMKVVSNSNGVMTITY